MLRLSETEDGPPIIEFTSRAILHTLPLNKLACAKLVIGTFLFSLILEISDLLI